VQFRDDIELLRSRISILSYGVAVVLGVLVFGFWQLQVIQSSHYSDLAEKNRIKEIRLVAPRGKIYDRNHKILADNRPSYNIVYIRENSPHTEKETVAALANGLGMSAEDLTQKINRQKKAPAYQPITLKEDAGIGDVAYVMAHAYELPEVSVEYQPRRLYRDGHLAAHALGYIGEVSEAQLRESPDLKPRDMVGKTGLELVYDTVLRGIDGSRHVVVNNSGREIEILPDEIKPIAGNDIYTTIDLDLQKAAEDMIGDRVGGAVVLDPRTGEVLALVSKPSFDPNHFASGISSFEFKSLLDNPDKPLVNRAIQSVQPPGSIFKIIEAAAGLESDTVTTLDHVFCRGSESFYGRSFGCWKTAGHGTVDMYESIVNSCDIYFYNLGKMLGIDKISQFSTMTGLGRKTGIDLPDEEKGLVPSQSWSQRVKRVKWALIETINVSIGQGMIGVTPIQAAWSIGGLASGGRLKQPRLVQPEQLRKLGFESPDVKTEQYPVKEETVEIVTKAMWGVVNDGGTATVARVDGFNVAGKTGTAQVVNKSFYRKGGDNEDHAWFVGFAPYRNPEIVVAVLIEHGGHGGEAAAPVAHAVLDTYYKKKTGHFNEGTAQKVASLMSREP
jgi:penicillin-binding protein 2